MGGLRLSVAMANAAALALANAVTNALANAISTTVVRLRHSVD